jgi:hypothetical protein
MTTYRVKHSKENPYVKLDKGFLQSKDLSAKAKGILAYLLSLPSDWRICLSHLVKVFSDGEASIRSGLRELKQAGYLTKASVRDRTGQIVSWVTDVYETPHRFNKDCDRHGNFSLVNSPVSCDRGVSPDVDFPHLDNPQLEKPHLEKPHLENRSQLINKDLLRNDLTNPPLPSQGAEKENSCSRNEFEESSIEVASYEQVSSSHLLVVQKDTSPGESSAAVSRNNDTVTKCKVVPDSNSQMESTAVVPHQIRHYNRALGINPQKDWKALQQKQFDWVANGPWLVDNKLDPNFVDWLAHSWQKEYGGTIHKKRSDVLRHFKKDPANIAISWEQYRYEHLHRYENAALRMHNGLEIKPDEQQQLLTHARAVINPLPDELNPVACAVEVPTEPLSSVRVFLPNVHYYDSASPEPEDMTHVDQKAIALGRVFSGENQLNTQPETNENNSFPIRPIACGEQDNKGLGDSNSPGFPTSDDGCVENPGAYREWKPTRLEDEPVSASVFSSKLAAFTKHLSMSVLEQELPKLTELTELEELNQWLTDPILYKEVMARVMRSDRYTVEFNEQGNPCQVVEIKD